MESILKTDFLHPVILGLFLLQKGSNREKELYWSFFSCLSYKKSKKTG